MQYYLNALQNYANFEGRARRAEYWSFMLINALISTVLFVVTGFNERSFLVIIFGLIMVVPGLAVTVRRLHDQDKSGWWWFIQMVPLIGGIWFFILTIVEGTRGRNQYGEDPKLEVYE